MSNRKKLKLKVVKDPEVIVLTRDYENDGPPFAVCTCGWSCKPNTNLMELGMAAKEHSQKTGHFLRRHDA